MFGAITTSARESVAVAGRWMTMEDAQSKVVESNALMEGHRLVISVSAQGISRANNAKHRSVEENV